MMFQQIRQRLLLSYLGVLISTLMGFSIAVRITFEHVLKQQLTEKLTALGQGAAANAEGEQHQLKIGNDFPAPELASQGQALQWFSPEGNPLAQQGEAVLSLPLNLQHRVQIQAGMPRRQGVTLPVMSTDDQQLMGYVRASQSLDEFDENLQKLNLGLGGGIAIALLFSTLGGLWLTQQAMGPIEESFNRLKQFTADASHELRSPLMAIKSNAAVALKYPEGIRVRDAEKFEAIASATQQMTQLTEDLLLLARNDGAKSKPQSVDLRKILTDLIQAQAVQAMGIEVQFWVQIEAPLIILGDTFQLTRLFANLIANALYYSTAGGDITISARLMEQFWLIQVQDQGIGIAPENLARIFDRFWRADTSRSHWGGGSGLGLAIALSIAQNHGGTITVSSQLGVGSCFTVSLPALN